MKRRDLLFGIIIITAIIIYLIYVFNNTFDYTSMSITDTEWDTITYTRKRDNSIKITSLVFNEYNVFIDDELNRIFYSLVNGSISKYNPNISYTTNDNTCKLVVKNIPIVDNNINNNQYYKIMIYNDSSYHIYDLVCTDLPIVSINYNVNDRSKNKDVDVYVFDNLKQTSNRVFITKSLFRQIDDVYYYLMFSKFSPNNNERENIVSLFKMKATDTYLLHKIDDKQEVQPDKQAQKVLLFINNRYQGYYNLYPTKPLNAITVL